MPIAPRDLRSGNPPAPGTPIDWSSDHADGLAAFWPCWEGAGQLVEDLAAGNHGKVGDGHDPTWTSPGGVGPAAVPKLESLPRNTAATIAFATSLNVAAFTFSCRILVTAVSGFGGIFQSRNSGLNGFQCPNESGGGAAYVPHLTAINSAGTEVVNKQGPSYAVPFDRERHFVWTWDGTTARLWVDGQEQTLSAGAGGWGALAGNFLGAAYANIQGPMWDFRVYNRARPELGVELYDPSSRWKIFATPRATISLAAATPGQNPAALLPCM